MGLAGALLLLGAGSMTIAGTSDDSANRLSYKGSVLNSAGGPDATAMPLVIPRFTEDEAEIHIDGRLDENLWSRVPAYDHMIVSSPDLGVASRYRTHTFIFYTDRGLYIGAWNEQPADTLLPRLAGRDSFRDADSYQIYIDSSGEGLYGYWFGVKLGGSLSDGIVIPERRFRSNWDGPWRGEAVASEGGWTVEMFLPWAMMSMPEAPDGRRRMAFGIRRELGELHEQWTWPALPRTQPKFISALQPIELADVAPRQEFSLYPYATYNRDIQRGVDDTKVGIDMFWRPSSAFLLSAAINPDFGQVELDDVVINLTAFETFFPEKRLFFLENQETFGTAGGGGGGGSGGGSFGSRATLLHTRRIGSSVSSRRAGPDFEEALSYDRFDTRKPVDLLVAAKGVGQWGKSRWGVLGAVEDDTRLGLVDEDRTVTAPGRDFAVLRWLYEDTERGDRRSLGWMGTVTDHPARRAITQSVDAHYRTPDGTWNWDTELFYSDVEGTTGSGASANLRYVPRRGDQHFVNVEYFDEQIDLDDVGFLPRNDILSVFYNFSRQEPDVENLRERRTFAFMRTEFNTDNTFIGGVVAANRRWTFQDNTRASVGFNYFPSYWDDRDSRGNGDFKLDDAWGASLRWDSDSARSVFYELRAGFTTETQEGSRSSLRAELTYRPIDRVSLRVGTRYVKRDSWLLWQGDTDFTTYSTEEWRPMIRLETFFTARQQLRLELEWVAIKARENDRFVTSGDGPLIPVGRDPNVSASEFVISDVTLQIRYRWQIAPLSDLFIVYNRGGSLPGASVESSFGSLFGDAFSEPQGEALIVKLRYRIGT